MNLRTERVRSSASNVRNNDTLCLLIGNNPQKFHGCKQCPVNTDCSSGVPRAEAGFWLNLYEGIASVEQCSNPSACPGPQHRGPVENNSFTFCGIHRLPAENNTLCAECADGFQESGSECVPCESTNAGLLTLLIFVLIIFVQLFFFLSQGSSAFVGVLSYFVQTALLLIGSQTNAGSATLLSMFDLDFMSASSGSTCVLQMTEPVRTVLGFFGPLLAFVIWALLFTIWSVAHSHGVRLALCGCSHAHDDGDTECPDGSQSVAKPNLAHRLSSPSICHTDSKAESSSELRLRRKLPLSWCTCVSRAMQQHMLWLWYSCYMRPASTNGRKTQWQLVPISQGRIPSRHEVSVTTRWMRTLLALFALTFNGVMRTAFSVFRCIDVRFQAHSRSVIEAYPAVSCDESAYEVLRAFAAIMCTLYLAVPILLVWHFRHTLLPIRHLFGTRFGDDNPSLLSKSKRYVLGALTAPYRGHATWWKISVLLRRLILVLVVVFAKGRGWRMVAASIVNLFVLLLHVLSKPFLHWIDNVMEGISLLSLVLLSTMLVQVQPPYHSGALSLLAAIWAIPFFVILSWVVMGWILHRETCTRITANAAREEYHYKHTLSSDSSVTTGDFERKGSERVGGGSSSSSSLHQHQHDNVQQSQHHHHPQSSSQWRNRRTTLMVSHRGTIERQHTSGSLLVDEPSIEMSEMADRPVHSMPDATGSETTTAAAPGPADVSVSHSGDSEADHSTDPIGMEDRLDSDDRLPPGWQRFRDEDNVPYFHNRETGISQWEKPGAC
jgi:WW domain